MFMRAVYRKLPVTHDWGTRRLVRREKVSCIHSSHKSSWHRCPDFSKKICFARGRIHTCRLLGLDFQVCPPTCLDRAYRFVVIVDLRCRKRATGGAHLCSPCGNNAGLSPPPASCLGTKLYIPENISCGHIAGRVSVIHIMVESGAESFGRVRGPLFSHREMPTRAHWQQAFLACALLPHEEQRACPTLTCHYRPCFPSSHSRQSRSVLLGMGWG